MRGVTDVGIFMHRARAPSPADYQERQHLRSAAYFNAP